MPTYDYECDNGHRFEAFQSMKEDALTHCVQCDATVRRRIGPGAGFIFKGGGFYQTENRSKDYKDKAKAESAASSSSGGESTKSSDAPAKDSSASKESGTTGGTGSSAPKKDASGGGSSGGSSEKP